MTKTEVAYTERVYRPAGRVFHAAAEVQVFGAPEGYTVKLTACGIDMGRDYSEADFDAPVTCRRCRAAGADPRGAKGPTA